MLKTFTPGSLPVEGALPHYEGIYLANGLGSSGLTSRPYIGTVLAKHIAGVPTELDFSLYDVEGSCL